MSGTQLDRHLSETEHLIRRLIAEGVPWHEIVARIIVL